MASEYSQLWLTEKWRYVNIGNSEPVRKNRFILVPSLHLIFTLYCTMLQVHWAVSYSCVFDCSRGAEVSTLNWTADAWSPSKNRHASSGAVGILTKQEQMHTFQFASCSSVSTSCRTSTWLQSASLWLEHFKSNREHREYTQKEALFCTRSRSV